MAGTRQPRDDRVAAMQHSMCLHSPSPLVLSSQVVDKEANANGGMLVIATSIPDKREWIQWKGRTARQDRPGQFQVVLNLQVRPLP